MEPAGPKETGRMRNRRASSQPIRLKAGGDDTPVSLVVSST
jgi:hypothetical protein